MAGNASDLSGVNTSKPVVATEPKSVLDDYHRELRRAAKRSIGKEHDLETGVHKFPSGDDSARPVNPVDGQVYFNTDRGAIEQYDATTDPDNPVWTRRFFQADQTIHLCGLVPGQRVGIAAYLSNLSTWIITNIMMAPGAAPGEATSNKLLTAGDVYLYKGTYTIRTSTYIARIHDILAPLSITTYSNASTVLDLLVGTAGALGIATMTKGGTNSDAWVDGSVDITVTTPGWYPLELYGRNASNGFTVQTCSVHIERTG